VLSAEETAEFLRLALQTVRNMTSRCELPFIKTGERGVGYRLIELIAWQEMDEDQRTAMRHHLMQKYRRKHQVQRIASPI
jgi:hypothetical protein